MDPASAVSAAYQGLSIVINCIDKLAQYRAEKKRQRLQRSHGQQQFLHEFSFAATPPDEESQEVETIRSYCRKLQNVIRAHWGVIFGRGRKDTQAAHAVIASTLFHMGAMPGLPSAPSQAQNLVAGILPIDVHWELTDRKFGGNISECDGKVVFRCCQITGRYD